MAKKGRGKGRKLVAKKSPGKPRKRIAKKRPDKDVAKSQKAEGSDMPPPPRPHVPDPSTWQPQDNNGGRIARENADRRRRSVAAQSGSTEPPFPPALSGDSISGGGDVANFSGTVSDPITEPGPTFHFVSGKLDLIPSPVAGEFDHASQNVIHRRILEQIDLVRAATAQVGNRYPTLARVVDEYAKIVNHPVNDLDVVELWTVGNCLLAHTRSFETQNQTQTLTEPLEPAHLALLTDVAGLHSAFILGFPQGRELTERADQAQQIAPGVIEPAARLLEALSQNRDLVSDRARRLFSLLTSAVGTCDWATTRVGYTVYATARNVLLAIGKIAIKANIRSGIVGSAIAAGAWQVSGMTPESVVLLIEFLRSNQTNILQYAASFPDLRAYMECVINYLDAERNAKN